VEIIYSSEDKINAYILVGEILESVHLENPGEDLWISLRYILEELVARRGRG
jgi:hypothetical protein